MLLRRKSETNLKSVKSSHPIPISMKAEWNTTLASMCFQGKVFLRNTWTCKYQVCYSPQPSNDMKSTSIIHNTHINYSSILNRVWTRHSVCREAHITGRCKKLSQITNRTTEWLRVLKDILPPSEKIKAQTWNASKLNEIKWGVIGEIEV